MDVYTDGSVLPSGEGRAGFIALEDNKVMIERVFSKKEKTTPNRMELSSIIAAIKYLKQQNYKELNIYTDSIYVINGVKSLRKWIKESTLDTKVNKELWLIYLDVSENMIINLKWIKGHEKKSKSTFHHQMNKKVDKNLKEL
jgi:ribonuclease HI